MPATATQIAEWLCEGQHQGATHVLIVRDTIKHEDYPVLVPKGESAREKVRNYNTSMHCVMEVYSLKRPFEAQLRELVTFNIDEDDMPKTKEPTAPTLWERLNYNDIADGEPMLEATGVKSKKKTKEKNPWDPHDLTKVPTRLLMVYLKGAQACNGSYDPSCTGQTGAISIEEIKAELAKRPHVPNKPEGQAIRKDRAKSKPSRKEVKDPSGKKKRKKTEQT